jgi:hypothetical protein
VKVDPKGFSFTFHIVTVPASFGRERLLEIVNQIVDDGSVPMERRMYSAYSAPRSVPVRSSANARSGRMDHKNLTSATFASRAKHLQPVDQRPGLLRPALYFKGKNRAAAAGEYTRYSPW